MIDCVGRSLSSHQNKTWGAVVEIQKSTKQFCTVIEKRKKQKFLLTVDVCVSYSITEQGSHITYR